MSTKIEITLRFLIAFLLVQNNHTLKDDLVGCYSFEVDFINTHIGGSVEICTSACENIFYRYAVIANGSYCYCGNYPGKVTTDVSYCNIPCPRNASQVCGGTKASSVYDTGVLVPGPPTDIRISNVTETTMHVWWQLPEAHSEITSYTIKSNVIATHSDIGLKPLEWFFSNNTFHTELLNLHPGTLYNITISAISRMGTGVAVHAEVETEIGVPEPAPPQAVILERHGGQMLIHIPPATNINGPISKYRIVVINQDVQQGFLPEYLKSYDEANEEGFPYYITAEINPPDIKDDFRVGNRVNYNGFYNAPVQWKDAEISIGVVSIKKGITKMRYTHSNNIMVLYVNEEEEVSPLVVVLGGAVAIGVVLLIIGLGIVIVLRRRVGLNRRQRLSQAMPLSGPCIEIENAGFVPDEDERVDHYGNLKRQLWNIPRNFLEVDNGTVVGLGSFGHFVRGRVQHHGSRKPSLVQAIPDGELTRVDRKAMLGELDLLIKANGHDNVISLIGICEIPDTLYVVLEDPGCNLKELLLSSRHRDTQSDKFCSIGESRVLKICLEVSKGIDFLASKKISHKRLCCRNIAMVDGVIPKVGGFGLSHSHNVNEKPDYTRWTALEMFKQNSFSTKSDVWSFGCLMWEVLALGGTPYPAVASKDVAARVLRGMRPAQLSYTGDDLYQVCLHCWQLDLDERPRFTDIVRTLEMLAVHCSPGLLNFNYFNGFQYESHSPELELI